MNKNTPNFLLFTKNQKYGISRDFLSEYLNHGYIYNQDIAYIIAKFCKLAATNGYLYLEISVPRKIKKIQNNIASITCQNFATKPIVT